MRLRVKEIKIWRVRELLGSRFRVLEIYWVKDLEYYRFRRLES